MQINDKSNYKAYTPNEQRYDAMKYKRCGNSGVLLPRLAIGLWHNFGDFDSYNNAENILRTAFDNGIVHFDLANNYGPPYGSAEDNFGRIYKNNFQPHRDELFLATKAGYDMWPGPYGNNGSRKYLISSLDQSLKRMQVDYVDLFYHHRPDTETPMEETALALHDIVRQGKALYVGVSNYNAEQTEEMASLLKELKVPFIIHQAKHSMFERGIEKDLLPMLTKHQLGCIAFSPLAQGLLTDKYLNGIPENSRAGKDKTYLTKEGVASKLEAIKGLNAIAKERGETLAEMAIGWLLHKEEITTVLLGASSPKQLIKNIESINKKRFSEKNLLDVDSFTKF